MTTDYFGHKEGCVWGDNPHYLHIVPRDCYVPYPLTWSGEPLSPEQQYVHDLTGGTDRFEIHKEGSMPQGNRRDIWFMFLAGYVIAITWLLFFKI